MSVNLEKYGELLAELKNKGITLVAVSKTKPVDSIRELYEEGQRDFGENYVQELLEKKEVLPEDIRWHFIGHLQSNKAKYLVPFVHLIHGVDSIRLLKEINKQAEKTGRIQSVLLQVHIAQEETKFGLDEDELSGFMNDHHELASMKNILISGLMAMASFTDNEQQLRNEFGQLKKLFDQYRNLNLFNCQFTVLSMGMSNDYSIAIEEGSNLVRIGSLIFGKRIG
ncbi:MAG: YggS family pyridoxal phosphate-dependent enzyme [Flavisolibacter sp.]